MQVAATARVGVTLGNLDTKRVQKLGLNTYYFDSLACANPVVSLPA